MSRILELPANNTSTIGMVSFRIIFAFVKFGPDESYGFKLFGILSNIILGVVMIQLMGSSQLLLMEFIFSIRKAELMVTAMHKYGFM